MSARKSSNKTPSAPLVLADCVVRAARGHETRNGIAFSGVLWIRDVPVAEFRNAGNGGCNVWMVRNRELFADFEKLARQLHPELKYEHEDHVVGELWDVAFLAAEKTAMGAP